MGGNKFTDDQESLAPLESWGSWFCRHGTQITKGGIAVAGLLALGVGAGYWFGRRSSAGVASSSGNAVVESTSALVSDAMPTPMSLVSSSELHTMEKPLEQPHVVSVKVDAETSQNKNAQKSTARQVKTSGLSASNEQATPKKEIKELVVNGTIPDQLLEVGHPWSATINMTALFGENATLTQFSSPALSDWLQASVKVIPPGVSGFYAYGVTVSGNLAYVAANYHDGLKIIDVSNSSSPFVISGVPGFSAHSVTVKGNLAYVAGDDGLKIVNISNSTNPYLIGGVSGFYAQGVAVYGNLAYVATSFDLDQGLKIIDISNSSSPYLIGGMSGFYNIFDVVICGNLAYMATEKGLQIVDISNSTSPHLIGHVIPGFVANAVVTRNTLAYVATWEGLKIINISNSTYPYLMGEASGFVARGVTICGNLAYAVSWEQGLQIIDIGNSTNPYQIGRAPESLSFSARGVAVSGNFVYVAGQTGLKIADLSFWQLSGASTQSKRAYQFIISSERFFSNLTKTFAVKTDYFPRVISTIPDQSLKPENSVFLDVNVFDVFSDKDKEDTLLLVFSSDPSATWLKYTVQHVFLARKTGLYKDASNLAISGNLAYVAAINDGLQIIDISDSMNPHTIGRVSELFGVHSVVIRSNLAYVAVKSELQIIDISNSTSPRLIGGISGLYLHSVMVHGNLAYVAANDGLKIIDISNSTSPYPIGEISGFSWVYDVAISGNLAYVAVGDRDGLKIIDVSNSTRPHPVGGISGFTARGIAIRGNLAYIAAENDEDEGLKIIDISNSMNPRPIGGASGFAARGIVIYDNLAYVATWKGLKIVDISRPSRPIVVGEMNEPTTGIAVLSANKLCTVGENFFGILDLTNYRFSGIPTETDTGNYNIQVTATDPDGAQAQTSFTIRVEGGPRLSSNVTIPPQIAQVGRTAIFFLEQGTFYDPNNDVITYASNLASGDKLPDFLSFNPSSATFTAVPTLDDRGKYLVTIFASDRIVYPPTPVNFTLAVQDPIPEQVFIVGRNNTTPVLPIPPDSTFEGRSLVYDVKPRNTKTLPDWLRFDADKRTLSGNPNATAVNLITMQVTLNDGYGEAFALFNLRVKFNTPPVLSSMIPDQSISAGNYFHLTFRDDTFTDADNDPLKYTVGLGSASRWLTFNAENRTFSGTPNGWTDAYPYLTRTYTITINATDLSNTTATGMFNVNLGGSNWTTLITALTVILGTIAVAKQKHLVWDFFRTNEYRKPPELLMLGDTAFSHEITLIAQKIKSITVRFTKKRAYAKAICGKKMLGFFGSALQDTQVRVFPCGGVSAYLFPWLFYDAKANTLKTVEDGPTQEFVDTDIKIQVRGTDNRIREEFHIKVNDPHAVPEIRHDHKKPSHGSDELRQSLIGCVADS